VQDEGLAAFLSSALNHSHPPQRRFVLRPSAAHLDPYLEINLAAKKPLHVEPGGRGNFLQLAPADPMTIALCPSFSTTIDA